MRIYKILFFLVVLLAACRSKTSEEILNEDEMTALLTDVHILDGSTYNMNQSPDSLYKHNMARYLNLYKQHHTDSAQFRKSFVFYGRRPDKLNDIYEKVIKNLKFKTDSVRKADSLHRVDSIKHIKPAATNVVPRK